MNKLPVVPVILAGGIGERFWPASRSIYPKQLLKLTGNKSMLEKTLDRIYPFCKNPVKPLVITGRNIVPALKTTLPDASTYDSIIEPKGKNTAPAICCAAAWIQRKYGESVMVILSADHEIQPAKAFRNSVGVAVQHAIQNNSLVTFGIVPDRPDTGYGYIHIGHEMSLVKDVKVYKVKEFVEKPSSSKASAYVKSGAYLWNSGMFIWKTSVILKEFERSLPALLELSVEAAAKKFSKSAIDTYYKKAESISVDYGIMEHASNVYAVAGTFFWDDIGSWEAMPRIYGKDAAGNTAAGEIIEILDCNDTVVYNKGGLPVVAVGLNDVSLIVSGDVVLAIDRKKLPDIKKYIAQIKKNGNFPEKLF